MMFPRFLVVIVGAVLFPNVYGQQHGNGGHLVGDADLDYYQDGIGHPKSTPRPSSSSHHSIPKVSKPRLPLSPLTSLPKPTPIPILKQINRHNEDGSYTYGFEGADGSFKIETKTSDGEVFGKYGYVDDIGKLRVVEYGANKYGFRPSGEGITIPPPTITNGTNSDKVVEDEGKMRGTIFQAVQKRKQNAKTPPAHLLASIEGQNSQPPGFVFYQHPTQNQPSSVEEPTSHEGGKHNPSTSSPADLSEGRKQQRKLPHHPFDFLDEGRSEGYQTYRGFPQGLMIPRIFETEYDSQGPPLFQQQQQQPQQQQQERFVGIPAKSRTSSPVPRSRSNNLPPIAFLSDSGVEEPPPLPRTQARSSSSSRQDSASILDQLIKQYALPPNGPPALYDISYGYY